MGLLDSLLGAETDETDDDEDDTRKFAILMNAGPNRVATASNGFGYAIDLDDAGHEVRLFLDGKATKWPDEFLEDPDRPYSHKWQTIQSRGLLVGACGYCANAFDAAESCDRANVELLSEPDEHAPSVASLADDDYEVVCIG